MKIIVESLGVLGKTAFDLGDLTVICGRNNTGKTYATYALFGFLRDWREHFEARIAPQKIAALLKDGVARIDLKSYSEKSGDMLDRGCRKYGSHLSTVFASKAVSFKNTRFRVELDPAAVAASAQRPYEQKIRSNQSDFLSLAKAECETHLIVTLLTDAGRVELPHFMIRDVISNAISEILFGPSFPRPFIACAERTGAAIFRKELNFARNRLLEEMSRTTKDVNPMELFFKTYRDYALPVKANVEFTRQLETVAKEDSFIREEHPRILEDFADIIGGRYVVGTGGALHFRPTTTRRRLTMEESSGAVRALLDVGFYLHHVARRGDLLMVDEPELNLHPENQRRVARLFARLVDVGVRVFVTTHSDYIVKELNTLIMLNRDVPAIRRIAEREGYAADERVASERVRVYMTEPTAREVKGGPRATQKYRLAGAPIDPVTGIEAKSFDETIETMNRIQDAVVWEDDA